MTAFVKALVACIRVLAVAATMIAVAAPGLAQNSQPGTAGVEARRQALFVAMLQDPTDLDIAFEYATLSAQIGDFEAAIATFERMLIFAPGLARIQLELAVLYYRIGAEDMARTYLEAVDLSTAPPAVAARVNAFIGEVDRQDKRLTFSGFIAGGGRFQTNANAAPNSSSVTVNGLPVVLDDDARSREDFSVFTLSNLHLAYDLRNQGDLIEADITIYNSHFAHLKRLNTNLAEATLGPSFTMERFGIADTRVAAYGILGGTLLGNDGYSTTYGAGARLETQLANWLRLETRAEVRNINYLNSDDYPTARLQTGMEALGRSTLVGRFGNNVTGSLYGEVRAVDARVGFKSFTEYQSGVRVSYAFFGPEFGFISNEAPWQVYAATGALYRGFDDPDPLIDPASKEQNATLFAETGLSIPLDNGFGAFATGQVRNQTSTYDTRDYFNASVTVGLAKRF